MEELNNVEKELEFNDQYGKALAAMCRMQDLWDDKFVHDYPKGLPAFSDLICYFECICHSDEE